MSAKNAGLRKRIEALESQRLSMSFGSIDYPRITAEIESIAAQLEPEHHWTTTPTFWVAVVAMLAACIAAYPVVQSFLKDQNRSSEPQATFPSQSRAAASSPSASNIKK